MTTPHAGENPRRLRALMIGLGPDGCDSPYRLITGRQCLVVSGSAETHAAMVETMLRLDSELERLGRGLGELPPDQLAEVAWRIDSPELHRLAVRLERGLRRQGRSFHESTPEQLTTLASDLEP